MLSCFHKELHVREEKTDSIKSTRNGIKSAFRSITSFWNNSGKKRNFLWLSFQNCLFILKQVLNQSKLHKSEKNCFDGHFKLGFVLKGDILWEWFMAFLQHFVLTQLRVFLHKILKWFGKAINAVIAKKLRFVKKRPSFRTVFNFPKCRLSSKLSTNLKGIYWHISNSLSFQ